MQLLRVSTDIGGSFVSVDASAAARLSSPSSIVAACGVASGDRPAANAAAAAAAAAPATAAVDGSGRGFNKGGNLWLLNPSTERKT